MLADGPVLDVLALVLWKDRHRNPDMTVLIREEDIKGFSDCTTYLKLKPAVRIVRPKGAPAMPAVAATRTRSAVPARPAEPPRPWVVVGVVEAGTENIIKPIENSEAGALLRDQADAVRRARERAPMLAQQLLADATAGVFSTAMIHEAAQALTALARA